MRVLVKAVDATHPDPVKDARGCFKRGDVIVAKPDGHVWGTDEGLPKFYQIDVTGITLSELDAHLVPRRLPDGTKTRARDTGLVITTLPVPTRTELTTTGKTTLTKGQFIAAMAPRP